MYIVNELSDDDVVVNANRVAPSAGMQHTYTQRHQSVVWCGGPLSSFTMGSDKIKQKNEEIKVK